MRDPTRIDRMIGLLREYWHKQPDLRLGQLVTNAGLVCACHDPDDIFYIEDDVMERGLRFLKEYRDGEAEVQDGQ